MADKSKDKDREKRSRRYADLVSRFYSRQVEGDLDKSLVNAYISSQSAPSMDLVDVMDAIVAYGDARVAEAKQKWKGSK
ncbi:hypothetical protein EVB32_118 [Rhizobium phage RHph_TM39]|uniref:Uncharacterized protein n=1 Tax=Rhizobium phage RHph_TM30 TaxID=2509764 RepID=A0A7S5R529_9CAUD|nr:hypothetical protein PQC16_gp118 [Rhizobium phage RHph_TM30]QIG71589.1 hypothetical protein EVB94_118 [Rhizobium phage RHph_TM40]QIG71952.1 hypothetical protein EVB95_118 [Rhizobium phage RHph_TM2_3B]QIG72314.1 hypothetical protein EVB96_118 [Rhizobium phage RHph_TM3_3_6]QIG77106.1 hypothetical protein EVB32_118 [Rhizobium phage RHph_TM39]QIG77705.1 hypothetical protein EVB64_118 [Rhizobium phage RHph_TM61]